MKRIYLQPEVIITTIQAHENFLTMSGGDTGIKNGGSSKVLEDNGTTIDPETKDRGDYDEGNGWGNGLW